MNKLKKILSYLSLYLLIFNMFSSILSITITPISYANDTTIIIENNKKPVILNNKNYSEDKLIVKFKKGKEMNNFSSFKNKGAQKLEVFKEIGMGVVSFNKKTNNIEKIKTGLNSLSNVEYVEYDYIRDFQYEGVNTTDTYSSYMWHLTSIKAEEALKIYNDTENKITVSVNDSGIMYNHIDLKGSMKDLSENCKSDTGAIISGGCPNSGRNFDTSNSVFPDNEIYDINGHGTHVAGTIGATINNGTGVTGVSQNASLIGSRIDTYNNTSNIFYVSNTIKALNFAVQNGAKIVNGSYGGSSFSQAEYDSISEARDAGVLFVVAAGNNNNDNDGLTKFYPAAYDLDNIITVASVGGDDNLAPYSNYGSTTVDIAAPGGNTSIDGGILSSSIYDEEIFYHNMNSFSSISFSGTGLDWNITSGMIETQSGAEQWNTSYTGSEDKTLTFDTKFDLSGAKFAKFDGHIECALKSGDNLEIIINDQVIGNAYPGMTYNRSVSYGNVILPIPSNLYSTGSELKLRFTTNSDVSVSYGCAFDNFSIIKYDDTRSIYRQLQGTSMASPVVTGAATTLWSYKPDLTYLQIKNLLLDNVDNFSTLSGKVLSSGKLNLKESLSSLISDYGITKNGVFNSGSFLHTGNLVEKIDLNTKIIEIDNTTINLVGSGDVLKMIDSEIIGTGKLNVAGKQGINIKNSGIELFSVSDDFGLIIKNQNGQLIDSSGAITYGNSIIISNTGTINQDTAIDLDLYINGILTQTGKLNNLININNSFTGTLSILGKANKTTLSGAISKNIDLHVAGTELTDFSFNYLPSSFRGEFICNELERLLGLCKNKTNNTLSKIYFETTHNPVNYEISGNGLVGVYTGTLTQNNKSIDVELSSGDGIKTFSGVLTNQVNQKSPVFTGSIELDQTAPMVSVQKNVSPGEATKELVMNIDITDIDFDASSILWSNNINAYTVAGLSYTLSGITSTGVSVTISYKDLLGNTGTDIFTGYILDNNGPEAPTNIIINNGETINSNTFNNISISGSGNIIESGGKVNYIFSDSGTGVLVGTGLLVGESFSFTGIDLQNLKEGDINYSININDTLGNIGEVATGTTLKDTIASTGSISLSSITNQTATIVNLISSEYPVDYTITGSITSTVTGTITSATGVNIELTNGDGEKNLEVFFEDINGNISQTYTGAILLDQTLATININSHTNNEKVETNSINLTGSVFDTNGIDNLIINSSGVTFSGGVFDIEISLNGGDNDISYEVLDKAGNSMTGSINIIRTTTVSNIKQKIAGTGSVIISFDTNLTSTGEILYGTGESNLNNSLVLGTNGLKHSKIINNLLENSIYYYKVRGNNNTYSGALSVIKKFRTAKSLDILSLSGDLSNTGSILLKGNNFSSTGAIFNSTGSLDIKDNDGESSVVLSLSGLTISSSSWDGVFNPPEKTTFSGSFTNTGYNLDTDLSFDIGSSDSELVLSGTTAQVNLSIGTQYNGNKKAVFRSSDKGATYNNIGICIITDGKCSFNTDRFSLFALATPTDDIPDNFIFTDIKSANLSTQYISNTISVTGINSGSTISIIGGDYSINSGVYTATTATTNSGDIITVRQTSSSSYSAKTDTTLTIGGVSDIYSVTTSTAPVSSGGGGGGGVSYVTCKQEWLECRPVAGSKTLFKWYKKSGFSCIGGNVGKECSIEKEVEIKEIIEEENIEIYKSVKEIEEKITFKINALENIYLKKKKDLISIEKNFDDLLYLGKNIEKQKQDYLDKYNNWLNCLKYLEENALKKDFNKARVNYKDFLLKHKELKDYNNSLKVGIIYVDGENLKYIKYNSKKIQKIQIILFNKIRRKQATLSIYKKANEVIYNLNTLLTNNNLTKEQIKLIRKDTISIYKNFIKEYTILSLYFLNFNKKENYISI